MGLSEAECMLFRMSIELNMTKPPFTSTFLIIGTFLTLIQVAAIFFDSDRNFGTIELFPSMWTDLTFSFIL